MSHLWRYGKNGIKCVFYLLNTPPLARGNNRHYAGHQCDCAFDTFFCCCLPAETKYRDTHTHGTADEDPNGLIVMEMLILFLRFPLVWPERAQSVYRDFLSPSAE